MGLAPNDGVGVMAVAGLEGLLLLEARTNKTEPKQMTNEPPICL